MIKSSIKQLETLTIENAHKASTVICKTNPEWGAKRFEEKGQPLRNGDYASTVGSGSNGSVLYKGEYHFWAISSYKS